MPPLDDLSLVELIHQYKYHGASDTFIVSKLLTRGVPKNTAMKMVYEINSKANQETSPLVATAAQPLEKQVAIISAAQAIDDNIARQLTQGSPFEIVNKAPEEQALAPVPTTPSIITAPVSSTLAHPYVLGNSEATSVTIDGRKMHVAFKYRDDPNVEAVVVDDFLSDKECDDLMAFALPKLSPSDVVDNNSGTSVRDPIRTSHGAMFAKGSTDLLAAMEARGAKLVHLPLVSSEGFQVLRYDPGQNYRSHQDFFAKGTAAGDRLAGTAYGNRVCTLLIYLCDVEQGGSTRFTNLGIDIYPKKGRALFFSYVDIDKAQATSHAGMPPIKGQKWVAVNWYRHGPYTG